MGIIKTWQLSLSAALVCAAVAVCLIYGQTQYRKGYTAATAAISAELAKTAQAQAAKQHAADAAYQKQKAADAAAERVQYVEIEKIIERPVYRNVCLDDDGLRELNRAIAR